MLALVRKFIILDLHDVNSGQLPGLAAITLALVIVLLLMRENFDRFASMPNSHEHR